MKRITFIVMILLVMFSSASLAKNFAMATSPKTLFWEGEHLKRLRANQGEMPEYLRTSFKQLKKVANEALQRAPDPVVNKELLPPSGDKHDYMSYSRYWWPNPETADGLPYVRRDGVVNYQILKQGDRNRIGQFYDDLEALALAAYRRYSDHALALLRAWFLSPETRMNPHLRYAQAVPGVADGRAPGVIDTRHFLRVLDGIALLDSMGVVKQDEMTGLREWFNQFLDWLLTSKLGQKEQRAKNNHGAWFAAQSAGIALFVQRSPQAKSLIEDCMIHRLSESIAPDGSLLEELKRTRSLHYTLFSLSAFAVVARLGEHVDIDVWAYEAPNGASIERALDYVAPHLPDPSHWVHPTLEPFSLSDRQSQLFYLASSRLKNPIYVECVDQTTNRYNGRNLAPLQFHRE